MNANVMIWLALVAMAAGLLLLGVFTFLARRDLARTDARMDRIENNHSDLLREIAGQGTAIRTEISDLGKSQMHSADRRSTALHNRINPVTTNLSEIKGMMEAFTQSFNNFTKILTHQNKQEDGES